MCLCEYCGVVNAIDRYIKKAEEDLAEVFEGEGRANPEKMVKDISLIEKLVTEALISETEYFITEMRKKKNLKQVKDSLKKIEAGDIYLERLKPELKEEFRNIIGENAKLYIKRTDSELTVKRLSKRTVNWVESWSEELADIMKLNSHKEIENILKKGLENGDGVAVFTQNILESGIRDEYYKARRVAVTEVLRAHNVAQREAFMQDPSVHEKMWRHTGEYRNEPRENHVDMDGQRVKKDEPFELIGKDGGIYYPMQPCDSSLPPEESVNCHCICQPVVSEEVLGLSLEERQRLQQEAIDEMDENWEKELDRKNREKAGFKDETDKININNPDFIKIKDGENVPKQTVDFIKSDLEMIPEKHQEILKDYVKEIRVEKEGNSCYDRENRVVYITENLEKGELIHELAHALETKLELHNNSEYNRVLNNGLENILPMDIIYDDKNYPVPIYLLNNSKFVSEYQGRIYPNDLDGNPMFNAEEKKLNIKCLGEYFSEGYKEFIINPNNLKEKDNKLYNYIKELL